MELLFLITIHNPDTLEELDATEAYGELGAKYAIKKAMRKMQRRNEEESKYTQNNEGTTGD